MKNAISFAAAEPAAPRVSGEAWARVEAIVSMMDFVPYALLVATSLATVGVLLALEDVVLCSARQPSSVRSGPQRRATGGAACDQVGELADDEYGLCHRQTEQQWKSYKH